MYKRQFFIYQCKDYRLNVVAFISEVLYVYYVIYNKEVSMETHRFPFSITHQRSFSNVRHVLINIFNVKILCSCCTSSETKFNILNKLLNTCECYRMLSCVCSKDSLHFNEERLLTIIFTKNSWRVLVAGSSYLLLYSYIVTK